MLGLLIERPGPDKSFRRARWGGLGSTGMSKAVAGQ
jgi:hypothetical protein